MKTTIKTLVCMVCRRVVGVNAELPAFCHVAIPAGEVARMRPDQLAADPRVHTNIQAVDLSLDLDEAPRTDSSRKFMTAKNAEELCEALKVPALIEADKL